MAEFKGLNKVPRGSAGGWTFTEILGKGVIKRKITEVNDANTEKQQKQRMRIRGLGKYSQQVAGLTEITLREVSRKKGMYHNNLFVSQNKDTIDPTTGIFIESELPKLFLSTGSGEAIKSPIALGGGPQEIKVTYSTTGYLPTTSMDTKVLWAVYNQTQNYLFFGDSGATLSTGSIDIGEVGDTNDDVFVYIIAFDVSAKKGSATQFLGKKTLPA